MSLVQRQGLRQNRLSARRKRPTLPGSHDVEMAQTAQPKHATSKNKIDGDPVQILVPAGRGGPFRDHLFFPMHVHMSGQESDQTPSAINSIVVGKLTPYNILDPLGDMSNKIQPYYLDQMFPIWNDAAVLSANVSWTTKLITGGGTPQNGGIHDGWWMIAVVTKSSTVDPVINISTLDATELIATGQVAQRAVELLKHNDSVAKVYYRRIKPYDATVTGFAPQATLTFPVDICKLQGAEITPAQYIQDKPKDSTKTFFAKIGTAATADMPNVHLILMTGNGEATSSATYLDSRNDVHMTLNSYWKAKKAAALSSI